MVIVGDRHKGDELFRIHLSNGTYFRACTVIMKHPVQQIILPYSDVEISSHLILVSNPIMYPYYGG